MLLAHRWRKIVSENPLFEKYGQTVRDGTVIFEEGQSGDKMYIIQAGVVRITKTIDGLYNRFMEHGEGESGLTFDRTVEEIALELASPKDRVGEVLYSFETQGVCKIDGNAIRLKDKQKLVKMAGAEE
jgi:hypothetical protein